MSNEIFPATQECGYCEGTGNDSGPDHVVGETGPCSHCHGSGKKPATQEWRVGSRVPWNVYEGNRSICQCHNRLDAADIVDAMNRRERSHITTRECECPVRRAAQTLVDEAGPITCAVRRTHINLVRALSEPCPCNEVATEDSLRVELTKAQAAQAQINKELIEERTTVIRLQAQDRDLYRAEVERMLRILCS